MNCEAENLQKHRYQICKLQIKVEHILIINWILMNRKLNNDTISGVHYMPRTDGIYEVKYGTYI